jgi:methylenetetrahydrofolate dehydrogenase (NADP+)/methenyltetrahydrofolate cyclohydrolase
MILDGRVVAKEIQEDIKMKTLGNDISLAIIAVGDNRASKSYIKGVIKTSEKLGINIKLIKLDENISTDEVVNTIEKINKDILISGIMIQMPLPKSINQSKIISKINCLKDVDGLTDINMGKLIKKSGDGFIPCTPLAIIELLKYYDIQVEGLDIVVIGRSNIVGKPIAGLLTNKGATVTICHSKTKNLINKTRNADVVIVAIGRKHFLTEDMVTENTIVVDVGINVVDKKLYGDADYDKLINKVKAITPVPGGIGAITNTLLIKNTVDSFLR